MAKSPATKTEPKRAKKSNLIPVVSDLESLSHCAARTLCDMAHSKYSNLSELTLSGLGSVLQDEYEQLREAIEELDFLIEEQGSDKKAILLDLEPTHMFAKIRSKCIQHR